MKISLGAKTLALPAPVWVIGTYDETGKANAMAASWAGICCSKPPCLGVSLRKATHTYRAIVARRAFTVNIPGEEHMAQADFLGLASGAQLDKFSAARLTPVKSELVNAPVIKEFPLIIECKLVHTIELGLHTQFVGEILDVKAEEGATANGLPAIEKIKPFLFDPGSQRYFALGPALGDAFSVGKKIA